MPLSYKKRQQKLTFDSLMQTLSETFARLPDLRWSSFAGHDPLAIGLLWFMVNVPFPLERDGSFVTQTWVPTHPVVITFDVTEGFASRLRRIFKRFWCKISIGYKTWEAGEAFPTLYSSHFQLLNLFAPEPSGDTPYPQLRKYLLNSASVRFPMRKWENFARCHGKCYFQALSKNLSWLDYVGEKS